MELLRWNTSTACQVRKSLIRPMITVIQENTASTQSLWTYDPRKSCEGDQPC